MMSATWVGTQREFEELRQAVKRNCTCAEPDIIHPSPPKCPACSMLITQDALNRLAYAHRLRSTLQCEEWQV
jgi:hypothetical protein